MWMSRNMRNSSVMRGVRDDPHPPNCGRRFGASIRRGGARTAPPWATRFLRSRWAASARNGPGGGIYSKISLSSHDRNRHPPIGKKADFGYLPCSDLSQQRGFALGYREQRRFFRFRSFQFRIMGGICVKGRDGWVSSVKHRCYRLVFFGFQRLTRQICWSTVPR